MIGPLPRRIPKVSPLRSLAIFRDIDGIVLVAGDMVEVKDVAGDQIEVKGIASDARKASGVYRP